MSYPFNEIIEEEIDETILRNATHFQLCVYCIKNTPNGMPFVQYLLQINSDNMFTFPKMQKYEMIHKGNVENHVKVFLSGLLGETDFLSFQESIEIDGYKSDSILVKLKNMPNMLNEDLRFGLMDEILNWRAIGQQSIDYSVTSFFLKNKPLIWMYDDQGIILEIPVVGYECKHKESEYAFMMSFGRKWTESEYIFHGNVKDAIRKCIWNEDGETDLDLLDDNNQYLNGFIIRCAVFSGKTMFEDNQIDCNMSAKYDTIMKKGGIFIVKDEGRILRLSGHPVVRNRNLSSLINI